MEKTIQRTGEDDWYRKTVSHSATIFFLSSIKIVFRLMKYIIIHILYIYLVWLLSCITIYTRFITSFIYENYYKYFIGILREREKKKHEKKKSTTFFCISLYIFLSVLNVLKKRWNKSEQQQNSHEIWERECADESGITSRSHHYRLDIFILI